jgi:hypothetical protein
MQGYLWIIWVKLAGSLWIIGGEIRQLINILFCGYRHKIEIPILVWGTVPQRVIKKTRNSETSFLSIHSNVHYILLRAHIRPRNA